MKTAISVPDETYERATRAATALGISRSALFTQAVQRFLKEIDADLLTSEIDAALERIGADDSWPAAVAAGRSRLAADSDAW